MIKRALYKFAYFFRLRDSVKIARSLEVRLGTNCKFLDDPVAMFGTEPYLIKIGNHVELTHGVRLITHDGSVWTMREREQYKNVDFLAPIVIGDNTFVGMNTLILPGTKIGNNVIIGAGSVVKGTIPDNTVYAGVPARFIKTIDEFEKVKKDNLLETKNLSAKDKESTVRRLLNTVWCSNKVFDRHNSIGDCRAI